MKRFTTHMVAMSALLAACAAGPLAVPTPEPVRIRVAFTSAADASDLPIFLAQEELRKAGYLVENKFFDGNDLAVEAITRGDADFAHGAVRSFWVAMEKAAPITTVMGNDGNSWTITARTDIKRCEDLAGKRFAIHSQTAIGTLMAKHYVRTTCPSAEPNYLIVANAANRVAAMLAGEIDATPLSAEDIVALNAKAPGRFHTIVEFAKTLPGLMIAGTYVNKDFEAKQPAAVKAYVRALLQARRAIEADAAFTQSEMARLKLADPGDVALIDRVFREQRVWDPNGGMSRTALQASLDYLFAIGDLKTRIEPSMVANFAHLDEALAALGSK